MIRIYIRGRWVFQWKGEYYSLKFSFGFGGDLTNFTKQGEDDDGSSGMLKLFVGGLNYLSLQSDIKSYFETFGRVNNCTLLIDKVSGKSKGFAFVNIEDPCMKRYN
jgi:RNA recognition motif-containing protein